MRAGKARGRCIGNAERFFDRERATALRDQGWGQIRIARALGVGVGRVHRWVQEEYRPPQRHRNRRDGGPGPTPEHGPWDNGAEPGPR
jgi:hypothetical protein